MFAHHEVVDGIGVAFTNRHGGVSAKPYDSLNLGRSDLDDPVAIVENFRRVRQTLDAPRRNPRGSRLAASGPDHIVTLRQEHTTEVVEVDDAFVAGWRDGSTVGDSLPGQPRLRRGDALITRLPRTALCIRVADCLPVVIADPVSRVVAAIHAGRVGLAGGILPTAVARIHELAARDHTDPPGLRAWIGPSVCGACYEVPEALRDEVAAQVPAVSAVTSWGTPSLDLAAGAEAQLRSVGVTVTRVGGCTRTDPDLFSHRRDGQASGRLAGLVWLTG